MRIVRVALCQLESHPALYGGHVAYLEEPFVPKPDGGSLSRLGVKGIDVQALQDHCRDAYAAWATARLTAVLEFLARLEQTPDLVLCPEGAILLESLPLLKSWSTASGATILAGTHTPVTTLAGLRCYADLGISDNQRKRAVLAPAGSVLPLIRHGKVALLQKRLASPFERTDVSKADPMAAPAAVYPIQTGRGRVDILPLVCIEALRLQHPKTSYDLVGLVSYDARPGQFQPFIDQQVGNRRPVLYCNDGRFGKSRIGVVQDNRTPSWLHDSLPDGLPIGDCILIADIDLDATAVEFGTTAPARPCELVVLASVVCEHATAAAVSAALPEIFGLPEGAARAERLARLSVTSQIDPLQTLRLEHLGDLERRGLPSAGWWKALGTDCVVAGQDDLRALEARLSGVCRDALARSLTVDVSRRADVAQLFLGFYAECAQRAAALEQAVPLARISRAADVVDREAEVRSVVDFLDSRTAVALDVNGLPQIGKSSVLDKALAQAGVAPVLRIPLTATSSVDYVLYTLLKQGAGLPAPPYDDPLAVARSASLRSAIRTVRVVVFERVHLLTEFGAWRDEHFGPVIGAIIDVAEECNVKVILETQRELLIEFANPTVRQRLRITGFQKHLRPFGTALFDAQLRRVGLSPDVLSDEQKAAIVERLGGHPVAIALAADASYDEGGAAVLDALKERKGFYLTFLHSLLKPLSLTDEDQTLLRLLTLARVPVDRSVVLGAVDFPAAHVLRNLVALGAIDIARDGRLEIAGVLRDYFDPRELPPELIESFHRAAATSFDATARRNPDNLEAAIEAEYHAGVVGMAIAVPSRLLDGALATAQEHFRSQQYDSAARILDMLLQKRRSIEVLRLAAQVQARRNQSTQAVALAKEVLTRDPRDTRLLADLVKISLSQYQEDTTAWALIEMAHRIGVEDVSVLVVEGRMYLRRHELHEAERVLLRARQLTRHNSWPYYYLGITYHRMGRNDDAIDILEEGQEFFYTSDSRSRKALNAIRTQLGLAYLLADDIDAAARILDPLFDEDPSSPQVLRAYAALTIKRDGIQEAQKAFARLNQASIRNRFDRCQFHLFYGLFQLGIDNKHEASQEFAKAHAADRSNVYVMMKWAATLFDIATALYADRDDVYKQYLSDCGQLVGKILEFDPDNRDGIDLLNSLHQRFGFTLGEG